MIARLWRNAPVGDAQRVVAAMINHAGHNAAALHRNEGEHHAHQRRNQRLLQNTMGEAEHQSAVNNRLPFVSEMAEAGKDETAKCEFLANRRYGGKQNQQKP